MPTKKLKGQRCVYCDDGVSTKEGDHVFARGFVPEARRDRLPKVPACIPCNNKKSDLERELVTVLPLGGRHADAREMLDETERRLTKNQRLVRELRDGIAPAVDFDRIGRPALTVAVPIRGEALLALTSLIARGLLYHHWKQRLAPGDTSHAIGVSEVGDVLFHDKVLSLNGERTNVALAEGAITYSAVRASQPQSLSVWRFQFFGGAVATGQNGERVTAYWALTGREQVLAPLFALLEGQ